MGRGDEAGAESTATYLRMFQSTMLPGLVQTPRYAQEVIRANPAVLTQAEVDNLVKVRTERQALLDGDRSAKVWFILAEGAVRQMVGERDVMEEQIRHLERVADLPNVTVQVLPFAAGAHPAITGSFVLLEFRGEDPVVYLENMTGALFLEEAGQVNAYSSAFDDLRAIALSPVESVKLIEKIRAAL